jgi:FAD/FMN-containing dehydrogenase
MRHILPMLKESDTTRNVPADTQALVDELRASIRGEVRFDAGSRALYATDGSNYRQAPIGVVIPTNVEDVIQTVTLCRRYHTPLLSRGAGTSLAGQTCNTAVVLDMSKYMHNIIEINTDWTEIGAFGT